MSGPLPFELQLSSSWSSLSERFIIQSTVCHSVLSSHTGHNVSPTYQTTFSPHLQEARSLTSSKGAGLPQILGTAPSRGLYCENGISACVKSSLNCSLPSAVVKIESALVLYHISCVYCGQVFNNASLTATIVSVIACCMLCRLPPPRHQYLYTVVRYIPLDATQYLVDKHLVSPGWYRAYNDPPVCQCPCACHPWRGLAPRLAVSLSPAASTPASAPRYFRYHSRS